MIGGNVSFSGQTLTFQKICSLKRRDYMSEYGVRLYIEAEWLGRVHFEITRETENRNEFLRVPRHSKDKTVAIRAKHTFYN